MQKGKSKYPDNVIEFIYNNYKGTGYKIMSEMIKDTFNYDIKPSQVRTFYKHHHLNSGLTGHFKKGSVSFNKGKKQSDFMSKEGFENSKKTRFKKGIKPHNAHPIGTVQKSNGYYMVKVDNRSNGNRWDNWKWLHHIMYELYYGCVPNGYMVQFKNGNRNDFSKDNLMIVSSKEAMTITRKKRRTEFKELTEAGLNVTRLEIKIKELMEGKDD